MLTNTFCHSYTHIHTDIQSYTLIHTRYTCSKQLACTIPPTRYDYFYTTGITKTKHSTHSSSHQKTSQQQISRIMVRLLAINPNKQISGLPSYSSKKFRDPPFCPPPLPSNLNSDWSLRNTDGADKKIKSVPRVLLKTKQNFITVPKCIIDVMETRTL